ncbi:MAG: HAD hydrolase-like protein [Nitrososphaerales archaeon]
MIIAAIVFDLDGVIVDSNQAIFATYQQTARIIGERVPSNEEVRRLLGQPSSINLKVLFGEIRKQDRFMIK